MMPIYVTGNENKARLFNDMVGIDLPHERVDVEEIQSLDIMQVVEQKALEAFKILKKPVLVEDTQLIFHALGRLPGPFIKWFLDELGSDGLCRLLDGFDDRSATAGAAIAFYDGQKLQVFNNSILGHIANQSKGDTGFGWNPIFIPQGSELTLGEMDNDTFVRYYKKIKPFDDVRDFLQSIDKA